MLTLVPLGALFLVFAGVLFSIGSNIDPAEWKEIAPSGVGLKASMPGTPRVEQTTHEVPAGKVEVHKFTVVLTGKNELFMVLAVHFPEDLGREMGGAPKLLELGRQDVLSASQGQLKSERQIVVSGCPGPGLEFEVLPPKGAIIKARIFATGNWIYQVFVHVPQIRLGSGDVRRFFESFQMSTDPGAPVDRQRD